ncbi:PTS transporter subunit EIIC [Paenibacillus sp. P25]|nr:PTS transporter subunit EIIC [Paenibacillus sp. P25]
MLIGFSAARVFGDPPYMGAVIGALLSFPFPANPGPVPGFTDFFGSQAASAGYHGALLPILLSVGMMSLMEKGLRRIIPPALDLLAVPFVTLVCTGLVSLLLLGPLGNYAGDLISGALMMLYTKAGVTAGFVSGGLYALIVTTGLHHGFYWMEAGLLSDPKVGVNVLLPIWSMANVSQGGAGLAVYWMTRNPSMKRIAVSSALSSFLGIIEPVLFGVNLKLIRPFIGAAVGGAFGGAYVVWNHVAANSYGLTGIPMIAIAAPLGMPNLLHYLIGFAISVITAFAATWIIGIPTETGEKDVSSMDRF